MILIMIIMIIMMTIITTDDRPHVPSRAGFGSTDAISARSRCRFDVSGGWTEHGVASHLSAVRFRSVRFCFGFDMLPFFWRSPIEAHPAEAWTRRSRCCCILCAFARAYSSPLAIAIINKSYDL